MTRDRPTLVLVGTGAYALSDRYGVGVVARSIAQWCRWNGGCDAWRLAIVHRSEAGRERAVAEWKTIACEIPDAPRPTFVRAGSETAAREIEGAHALFVCVPDDAHPEYLEQGVGAGVPTWVVKPMTADGLRSAALAELADRRGVPLWVDYHKRFDLSNRTLRTAVMSGEHGAPRLYSVRYSQPRDLPLDAFAWTSETNVFSYIGCHYVDQLLFLFPGIEICGLVASGVPGPVFERFGGAAWDTVLARFDCRWRGRPLTAQLEVGWSNPLASPTKSLQGVELAFERARVFADQTHRGLEFWSDETVSVPNPHFFARVHDPLSGGESYQGYGYESVRRFLDLTRSSDEVRRRALANDSLPWARSAARVDEILDDVERALDVWAGSPSPMGRTGSA